MSCTGRRSSTWASHSRLLLTMQLLAQPRCQLQSRLARPSLGQWLRTAVPALRNRLRLRTRWRDWRNGEPSEAIHLGDPSRFVAGIWVRVVEPGRILATLGRERRTRGLLWLWHQWAYCGTVHRVFRPVRRMMDDAGKMRAISRTVMLDTVPCGGPQGGFGCGRDCPMMFRDEWLEEVPPPTETTPAADEDGHYARVRGVEEIRATLDAASARNGLMFMPEMYAYAGQRFRVRRRVEEVLDRGRYLPVSEPVYILEGLHCTGAVIGEDGPCDRACRLLWHEDWLHLE
jgi:hypothetical protein